MVADHQGGEYQTGVIQARAFGVFSKTEPTAGVGYFDHDHG
jgi:hypothetical protein